MTAVLYLERLRKYDHLAVVGFGFFEVRGGKVRVPVVLNREYTGT